MFGFSKNTEGKQTLKPLLRLHAARQRELFSTLDPSELDAVRKIFDKLIAEASDQYGDVRFRWRPKSDHMTGVKSDVGQVEDYIEVNPNRLETC